MSKNTLPVSFEVLAKGLTTATPNDNKANFRPKSVRDHPLLCVLRREDLRLRHGLKLSYGETLCFRSQREGGSKVGWIRDVHRRPLKLIIDKF